MATSFQQQSDTRNLNLSKSVPTPQHGQQPDRETLKRPEPRSFTTAPRPH